MACEVVGGVSDDRCQSGPQCVARTSDGAAVTRYALCVGCVADIQKLADELPGYLGLLSLFKGYVPQSVGSSRVSSSSEPKSPLNLTVVDLIEAIRILLHGPAGLYSIRDLITLPNGPQLALLVRRLHSKADGIIGLKKVWQRRHAPCPDCSLPTLGGWAGDDVIRCTASGCGTVMSKSAYEDYCELQSKEKK